MDEPFRRLLNSSLLTKKTREVLDSRLRESLSSPKCLTAEDFENLIAFVRRVLPDIPGVDPRWCVLEFDKDLSQGKEKGWRYEDLPPGIEALHRFFRNDLAPNVAKRCEEDIATSLAKILYSHPAAMQSIGYDGFADGLGWNNIGLNRKEKWESNDIQEGGSSVLAVRQRLEGKHYSLDEEVDAVIVGSGAGGAPLAARLCAHGLKVVMLEAGLHWTPETDFATDERAQEFLYWQDERISGGEDPLAFGGNNSGIGVGGTTLHFTGYVPRPNVADFQLRSRRGVGEDWPLSLDNLEPYLEEVEKFIGISGPSPYPWDEPRSYPLPPLPLNAAAELMQRGCKKLGIKTSSAPNAALSKPYYVEGVGWRSTCVNRGFCQAGCNRGAKGSTDTTYIPFALRHGLDLRPNCFALALQIKDDLAVGVEYDSNGKIHRQKCRAVFLCCGAIETPRLLLKQGIANGSGQVGNNFMAHVATQVWGFFEESTDPWKGIPGGLISEDFRAGRDYAGGYILQSIGIMPLSYLEHATRDGGLRGDQLGTHMSQFTHLAGINIHGECLPHANNQMILSDEVDVRGLRKPLITFTQHENERAIVRHGRKVMEDIWKAAGAKEIWSYPRNAHTLGTCRMGIYPSTSVVNKDGRVHDYKNLYICDTSIFPSSLTSNPALPMMALSLRIADRFLGEG